MDITQGAIEAIQKPVREAEQLTKAVTIMDVPGDARRKLLVQSGQHEFINVAPKLRDHTVGTLADLINQALLYDHGSIWFAGESVTLLIDDADRRERVTFCLCFSDAWLELLKLKERGPLSQKDVIRLLKMYLGASSATIAVFRKLDFESRIKTSGQVDRGRESLGKSVESQVQGTADLPEELMVTVPIYSAPGERQTYDVKLLIDYDVQAARILIEPEPDLLDELVEKHLEDIRDRLQKDLPDYQIYFGNP